MLKEAPKAYGDIDLYLLFEKKDKLYLIGSITTDRYIIVKDYEKDLYFSMLKDLNGINTIDEISEKWDMTEEEVLKVINGFSKKGLIQDAKELRKDSEIKNLSKNICSISCKYLNKIPLFLVNFFVYAILSVALILFIINVIFAYNNGLSNMNIFKFNNSYLWGFLFSLLIMTPSVMFHEICHALVARKYKLNPSFIDICLYLYLFPLFYVKINGLYTVNRIKRIKIFLAGYLGNFLIANISLFLYFVTDLQICIPITLAQLNLILVNCNPFNLTDAYFIGAQIMKSINIRSKLFNFLANDFKSLFTKEKMLLLYFSANIIIVIITATYFSNFVIKVFTEIFGLSLNNRITTVVLTFILIIVYFLIIKIKYRKLKTA